MIGLLVQWLLTALILLLMANIMPGFRLEGFGAALVATLVLGIVNALIRPIVLLLTLPLTLLTLGLFAFVVNALMLLLVAWIVPGFEITNFWTALLVSLLLAVVTALLGGMTRPRPSY